MDINRMIYESIHDIMLCVIKKKCEHSINN